ncbi:multicopper oxidase domain-containing protein [Actinacidiphila acidipaludis]|uniref:Multicopper oxidase domain-containing protein n=1 Tax=Actinacidiphila acidipaludis TaxID=2873382 RepID=A0ABS7QIT5_9ACTN|nr:multicopper oxidase domain-containing protein [Streptomyces acidipaludis]MBY8883085.1 multicopper oxidase domain-containing protein [Streptomyces acidipaludis]
MASDPPSAPAPAPHPGNGRRTLLRALTGGGALAALSLSTAPRASAAAPQAAPAAGRAAADPFALDRFEPTGRVREYWIQADSFTHNLVPNGKDGMTGDTYTAGQTSYQAVGYRAYTPNWGSPLPGDPAVDGIGPNTGIPGPVLRGQVGDVIRVHFRNNDAHYQWPHSMHPHGVRYTPDNDGGWMADDAKKPGTAVAYGDTYTYTWECTPGSVGSWPYHDHAVPETVPRPKSGSGASGSGAKGGSTGGGGGTADAAGGGGAHGGAGAFPGGGPEMEVGAVLGLFGMIAVTDEQTPPVDREFVLFLHDLSAGDAPALQQDLSLCNGGAFVDNAPTFTAKAGDRVRWRVGTLGNSLHVFHLHGHRWQTPAGWVDSQVLGPATTLTLEYQEDNPGDWLYHCHMPAHMMRGMAGRYVVSG